MPYTDLLRVTVFLTAAEATALGAITAIAASRDGDTTTLIVAAAWWLVALAIGLYLGRPARAADGVRDALARARTATSLPPETPARIALGRLWPIGAHRARRRRASASSSPASPRSAPATRCSSRSPGAPARPPCSAIEQRDGVKFYVVPTSALRPIELVRTPGPAQRPPPPPTAASSLPGVSPRLRSFLNSRQPRVLATVGGGQPGAAGGGDRVGHVVEGVDAVGVGVEDDRRRRPRRRGGRGARRGRGGWGCR